MSKAERTVDSSLNDLYRTAVHLTASNRQRAAQIVIAAVNDVWQNKTSLSGIEKPRIALFRALIRRGRQVNSWPHRWWERSISAAFSDMTNEPDIISAVDSLPLPARETILLVDGMGFRYGEASAVLDLDRKTLALRLNQARAALQLRTMLTPHRGPALADVLS